MRERRRPAAGPRAGIAAASSLALLASAATADTPPSPATLSSTAPSPTASPAALSMTAASPAAIWQDVASVAVTCLVHTPRGVDTGALHRRLCAAVRAQAAKGAPVPVSVAAPGGEALAPGRVTLLVQGGVSTVRGAPVLALSIRPFRNMAEAGQMFAAAPRAVAPDDAAALDAAIAALLAETLPWQAGGGGGPRRIIQQ